jgi:hypothetical protein
MRVFHTTKIQRVGGAIRKSRRLYLPADAAHALPPIRSALATPARYF